MKKIIILIVLFLVSCTGITTTTAFPYYEKMQKISPMVEIELQNGITRSDRVLVSHMYKITDEKIVVYYSQDTGIYYIYKLSNDVLEDNCTVATDSQLEKIFL
jgi:hypothetical protein